MRLVPYNPWILSGFDHYALSFLLILIVLWSIHEYTRWVILRYYVLRLEYAYSLPIDLLKGVAWEQLEHFRVTREHAPTVVTE